MASPVELQFPAGGVVRRLAYQSQPPYSTPDALNVVPYDPIAGRYRGGSRPGLGKMFATALGSPIRSLNSVHYELADHSLTTRLVAIAGGTLYKENDAGTALSAVSGSLNSTGAVRSAEFLQKLYVAEWNTTVTANMKIFDPKTDTLSTWTASEGTTPHGCRIICYWQNRLIVAGDPRTPHAFFACRRNDPLDWDYTQNDQGAAWQDTASVDGSIGDEVTALIPHNSHCLLIGGQNSIYAMHGDPAMGGRKTGCSMLVGPVSDSAWCHTPEGVLLFLSRDGIYSIPPGCGGEPQPVSRETIPEELLGTSPATYTISLAFDLRYRCVRINLTHATAGSSKAWILDWGTKSWWPVEHASAVQAYSLHTRRTYATSYSEVAVGCRDGYVRHYKHDVATDDGTAFDSYVWLGPIMLGPFGSEGMITEIEGRPAASSDDIDWALHVGNSPEEAFAASAFASGSWNATGHSYRNHPRARGQSSFVKLTNGGSGRWAMEGVTLRREALGRLRRA